MKKIISVIFVLSLVLILCSCQLQSSNYEQNAEWSPGYIKGNTYINKSLGIKFVKDDSWVFDSNLILNENGLSLDMAADFNANRVEVSYLKVENSQENTAEGYSQNMINSLSDIGWEFTEITERSFYGQRYFSADGKLTQTHNNYRFYAKSMGDYIVIINMFAYGTDISSLEAMFFET